MITENKESFINDSEHTDPVKKKKKKYILLFWRIVLADRSSYVRQFENQGPSLEPPGLLTLASL